MNKILNEFKAGFNEVRWIGLFSVYLLITTSLAVLISYAFDGKFANPPSLTQILLLSLSGLVSLFLALSNSKTRFSYKKINNSNRIYKTPGTHLLKLANVFYGKDTVSRIFMPLFADFQEEYFEAIFQKKYFRARWVSLHLYYQFYLAVLYETPIGKLFEAIKKLAK